MSQNVFSTIIPSTTSGNQLAALLNDFKNAIMSGFSGTVRPSAIQSGGYWIDITNDASGTWDYKIYDGTQDILVFTINKNTGAATFATTDALFKIEKISADSIGPILQLLKKRLANAGQTLSGDTLGEIQFRGYSDSGNAGTQARVRSVATDNVTATNSGAILVFEITEAATASLVEVMRLVDKKLGVNVAVPSDAIHAKGTGIRSQKESDDTVGAKFKLHKNRISGSGQVLSGDTIGSIEGHTTLNNGTNIDVAAVEMVAVENHTTTAQGTKIVLKNKRAGTTAYTEQVVIQQNVTVKTDLTVEGNFNVTGTTTSVNAANLDVADANITVNKGGTQSSANTNKAGISVEMTDAPDAQLGYDSTKTSKFVIGEIGSESEVATCTLTQTFTNKTHTAPIINTATINNPAKLEAKIDTDANLVIYATTATDGQWCWASDSEKMYYVKNGLLIEPLSGAYNLPASSITGTVIDWTLYNAFFKDISANTTFTFSNLVEGKTITVALRNTTGATVLTVNWPTAKVDPGYSGAINPGKDAIFTFMRINNTTYLTAVKDFA